VSSLLAGLAKLRGVNYGGFSVTEEQFEVLRQLLEKILKKLETIDGHLSTMTDIAHLLGGIA
jgi:ferritin